MNTDTWNYAAVEEIYIKIQHNVDDKGNFLWTICIYLNKNEIEQCCIDMNSVQELEANTLGLENNFFWLFLFSSMIWDNLQNFLLLKITYLFNEQIEYGKL